MVIIDYFQKLPGNPESCRLGEEEWWLYPTHHVKWFQDKTTGEKSSISLGEVECEISDPSAVETREDGALTPWVRAQSLRGWRFLEFSTT